MAAQALYRKWRPQTFDEVIGQDHVTRTLRNALRGGKVAHAYLFAGPRGTGKTSMARILAKAVNCLSQGDEKPCNQCAICRSITEGRCMDLIEIDAASNRGIDEIRDLREKVNFAPSEAKYKVYVIDESHMLTNEAFNALLKTLEEPPPHVIFVLATTAPHKIPPTVLSRCQRFDFHHIALEDLERKLTHICQQEGITIEPTALELVARNATGSFRDAESLLDQLVAYGGGGITLAQVQAILGTVAHQAIEELVAHILARDVKAGLHLINRVIDDGNDPRQFNHELMEYLRGLLLIKTSGDSGLLNVTAEAMAKMLEQAKGFSLEELIRTIKLFHRSGLDLKTGLQPQLPLELAFIEATLPDTAEAVAPPRPSLSTEATAPPPRPSPPLTKPLPGKHEEMHKKGEWNTPTANGERFRLEEESRQSIRADKQPFGLSPRPEGASADGSAERSPRSAQRKPLGAEAGAGASREGMSQASLEQVRGSWPEVLARIKPRNRSIEALLKSCEPIAVVGDMVVLGFYYSFHKERIEEPENKAFVEGVLSETMGSTYRIRCVLSPKDRQERYQAVIEDPLVKAAVKMYGAKIVDVQSL